MKKELRNLIAKGKTEQTIQQLLAHTKSTDLHKSVVMQSAKYQNYKEASINGLLSHEEDKTTLANINHSLLLIIEKLKELEEKSPEHKKEKNKQPVKRKKDTWKIIGYIALVIGILAGIAEFSGYSIRDIILGNNKQSDSFSVTVLVHGKEGRDQLILKNQGEVILDIGGDRKERHINHQGKAIFLELPGKYENETALISVVHPQPYFPVERDKEYQLTPNKVIYLPIKLTGLNKIKGLVIDAESESPLDSVRVSVENVATYTDEFGWFELDIPQEKQAKFVRVTFLKDGYIMEPLDSIAPHTNQEIQIALQKK